MSTLPLPHEVKPLIRPVSKTADIPAEDKRFEPIEEDQHLVLQADELRRDGSAASIHTCAYCLEVPAR